MSDMSLRHEPEKKQRETLERLFERTELCVFEMFRKFAWHSNPSGYIEVNC